MEQIIQNLFQYDVFVLVLVVGIYLLSIKLHLKIRFPLLNPVLITILVLIGLLIILDIPYTTFKKSSQMINFLLGPSVVALGYILHKQIHYLKGNVVSVLTSITVGAVVGIASILLIGKLFGADQTLIASLAPKSVTTPIAMALSESNGGIPALTAVVVVVAGVMGSIIAPPIMNWLGIKSPIAKGIALGASSHGVGTATAIQMGAIEGALSGLAIGIMGTITSLLLPLF
ncbi:MAG: LrgB family protein [Porphyromonas sp.]|nr:LrgB family protein [Porphyromonas sp.]